MIAKIPNMIRIAVVCAAGIYFAFVVERALFADFPLGIAWIAVFALMVVFALGALAIEIGEWRASEEPVAGARERQMC